MKSNNIVLDDATVALNHGRNANVGAPIVVLITKIAEASATIQNAIYVEKSTSSSSHLWGENIY